ncbi:MAG: hypothetical protein OSB38_13895 [Paraburkholderia fungorum]|nr:hypothetical protein [Paraburkholderia fungorum]
MANLIRTRTTNAQIIRTALETADIRCSDPDPEDPNLVTVSYEDEGNTWVTFIFTNDDDARIRLYSTFNLDLEHYDPFRIFEAVNFVNYQMLLDAHFEINPVLRKLRYREVIGSSSPVVNPVEFIPAFEEHGFEVSVWQKMMPMILGSKKTVDEAAASAWDQVITSKSSKAALETK